MDKQRVLWYFLYWLIAILIKEASLPSDSPFLLAVLSLFWHEKPIFGVFVFLFVHDHMSASNRHFDSCHVFSLGSSAPLLWLNEFRIHCPCCDTEFSLDRNEFLLSISINFDQMYQSFDIQNAKRFSWIDIYLSFALKRGLPALLKQNFCHQLFILYRNVLSIFCVPGTLCFLFFASQNIFLRKIRNPLR